MVTPPHTIPIKENFAIGNTTNPYGTSKYMIERIFQDTYILDNNFQIVILRYFNPVGSHESGTMGKTQMEYQIILYYLFLK